MKNVHGFTSWGNLSENFSLILATTSTTKRIPVFPPVFPPRGRGDGNNPPPPPGDDDHGDDNDDGEDGDGGDDDAPPRPPPRRRPTTRKPKYNPPDKSDVEVEVEPEPEIPEPLEPSAPEMGEEPRQNEIGAVTTASPSPTTVTNNINITTAPDSGGNNLVWIIILGTLLVISYMGFAVYYFANKMYLKIRGRTFRATPIPIGKGRHLFELTEEGVDGSDESIFTRPPIQDLGRFGGEIATLTHESPSIFPQKKTSQRKAHQSPPPTPPRTPTKSGNRRPIFGAEADPFEDDPFAFKPQADLDSEVRKRTPPPRQDINLFDTVPPPPALTQPSLVPPATTTSTATTSTTATSPISPSRPSLKHMFSSKSKNK